MIVTFYTYYTQGSSLSPGEMNFKICVNKETKSGYKEDNFCVKVLYTLYLCKLGQAKSKQSVNLYI